MVDHDAVDAHGYHASYVVIGTHFLYAWMSLEGRGVYREACVNSGLKCVKRCVNTPPRESLRPAALESDVSWPRGVFLRFMGLILLAIGAQLLLEGVKASWTG